MSVSQLTHIPIFGAMEFSRFRLKPGVTEAELFAAAEQAENGLMSQEVGFLGHALLKDEEGVYVDVVFATSRPHAEAICAKWADSPHCAAYLESIEEGTAELAFLERIK